MLLIRKFCFVLIVLIASVSFAVVSCSREYLHYETNGSKESPEFSLEEAKGMFNAELTRSGERSADGPGIVPYVFAPDWNRPEFYHLGAREKIVIPIAGVGRRVIVERQLPD